MTTQSFADVWDALRPYLPPQHAMREVYRLDNMRALMRHFGNPQDSYKTIHIAGTSGKTSTAYYAASILAATGKKVGLTVSPHVNGINERVQMNLVPVDEQTFCRYFSVFIHEFQASGLKATVFELLVGFAYWVFAQEKVDYAVIEVGLGGLLDGTNVINRPDKTCVITDIGYDHTDVLGKTIPEIAAQKAGIIHPHNAVFLYEQSDEVMSVIHQVCGQQQAELHEIRPLPAEELPKNLPLFQRRNWHLALVACQYIIGRDRLRELTKQELTRTTQVTIPARMEIIRRRGKTVVLDGAHNAQKMAVLAESLRAQFPQATFAVLFALVQSENFRLRTSVESILKLASHMVITGFDVGQEFRRVSVSPAEIAEHCRTLGYDSWEVIEDPGKAYREILKRPEDVILITGSFYMIDQLRAQIHPHS